MDILLTALALILLIFIVVFVHELGHFLFARMNGVKVKTFSIGFGKPLYKWTDKKGTDWVIAPIPLGGYVKMEGQEDLPSKNKKKELPKDSFLSKNKLQKLSIMLAGAFFNILSAFLIFVFLLTFYGKPMVDETYVNVQESSIAQNIGLKNGDKILKINNSDKFKDFQEIAKYIQTVEFKTMKITAQRGDEQIQFTASDFDKTQKLGILPDAKILGYEKIPFSQSFSLAYSMTYNITKQIVIVVKNLITGKESSKNLGGVISIGKAAKQGLEKGLFAFLTIVAILSINLGLINLLPIPALDGGHALILMIEIIICRDLPEKFKNIIQMIGLFLLLGLMLLSIYNDIIREIY